MLPVWSPKAIASRLREIAAGREALDQAARGSTTPRFLSPDDPISKCRSKQRKDPPIPLVGGKGFSLVYMANSGIRVPPGFVLTTSFFKPWIDQLRRTSEWSDFQERLSSHSAAELSQSHSESDGGMRAATDALKAYAAAHLTFSPEMKTVTDQTWSRLSLTLVAVRSSSPDEDLGGASFAGGYETVLGVNRENLESAILQAFVSCLDVRVVLYKLAHGFSALSPSIAIVVQQQVDSAVAGVAFSVNPLTNSHNEVFINSNFGLGETVVAGLASPDEFVVDKSTKRIIKKTLGAKNVVIKLLQGGGTAESAVDAEAAQTFSLSDHHVVEIASQVQRIESLYGRPMDIEYGIEADNLYILQARPVTTSLDLSPMITSLNNPKQHFLWDITLAVQGLPLPMSVFGTNVLEMAFNCLKAKLGQLESRTQPFHSFPLIFDAKTGRIYGDVSLVHSYLNPNMSRDIAIIDPLSAKVFQSLDANALALEPLTLLSKLWIALRVVLHAPLLSVMYSLVRSYNFPRIRRHEISTTISTQLSDRLAEPRKPGDSLFDWTVQIMHDGFTTILQSSGPTMIIWRKSLVDLRAILKPVLEDEQTKEMAEAYLERIDRSLPGNVTIEMGLSLAQLAHDLAAEGDRVKSMQPAELEEALAGRSDALGPKFAQKWKTFMDTYGHRGDTELDASTPRYRESSHTLINQLFQQMNSTRKDPIAQFNQCQTERQEAYEYFAAELKKHNGNVARFDRIYTRIVELGGLRETHKFNIVKAVARVRQEALAVGKLLVEHGKIESVQQVFDFEILDLDGVVQQIERRIHAAPSESSRLLQSSPHDGEIDLAKVRERRLALWNQWTKAALSGNELPRVMDSYGTIYREIPLQRTDLGENCLVGYPMSAGVVEGRIKILESPDEKPLLPGEILVARCTNPGWTPLFINAAAVVLEVGGVLQHGALVAREYGIPCVAGILGLLKNDKLKDSVRVRVDGNQGIVTILDDGDEPSAA
ncbi:pyruvate phosphate dikinase [Polychytrium aggregatum]|uniref:pyruvate phosphate dikinase n=1 Tax=Polychytrium aggregatum TaxID=110093 RepID=UPI0022FE5F17|nr:pyruvate phosphate dikinase [Polychytrium aggregatum]KAI9202886.1 pyruvate phosphate dikinase [Polychytrium aggregatum]